MDKWKPIETLFQGYNPHTRVLVTDGYYVTSTFIGYPDIDNVPMFMVDDLDEYEQELAFKPTHWMLLPEPPKVENKMNEQMQYTELYWAKILKEINSNIKYLHAAFEKICLG